MFRFLRGLAVASAASSLLLACSGARPPRPNEATPGIVFPVHFAEGKGDGPAHADGAALPSAPLPPEAPPPPPPEHSPPDPEPLRTADQVEYTFTYEDGVLKIESARLLQLPQPLVTARKMGRFAVELWVGNELIDRIRFDFPFLAIEDPKPATRRRPLHEPQSLAGGTLRATVLVPNTPRPRRAPLLDRATHHAHPLPWPPTALLPSSPAITLTPAAPAPVPAAVTPPSAASSAAPPAPRPRKRVTNSRAPTPLACISFGNIEIAVNPGSVLISLTQKRRSASKNKSTRASPSPSSTANVSSARRCASALSSLVSSAGIRVTAPLSSMYFAAYE